MSTTMPEPLTVAGLIDDEPRLWQGQSGEQVTGEQVAHHLEATIAFLERVGWERVYSTGAENELGDVDDSMTVKDMLRTLIGWIRTEDAPSPRNLPMALSHIANTDDGDSDTYSVGNRLCDVVVRARTNSPYANATAWASKLGRTWPEVRGLLVEAAGVARTYGPAAR